MNKSFFSHSWLYVRNSTVFLVSSDNVEFVQHIVKRCLNRRLDIVQNQFVSITNCIDDRGSWLNDVACIS